MDEEHYSNLKRYLACNECPSEFSKPQRYVLKRASKSFILKGQQLLYVDQRPDKSTFERIVIEGKEEAERVFEECHLGAGGHRGRDATIGKIKARYYWPNYYKEVEEKVGVLASYMLAKCCKQC